MRLALCQHRDNLEVTLINLCCDVPKWGRWPWIPNLWRDKYRCSRVIILEGRVNAAQGPMVAVRIRPCGTPEAIDASSDEALGTAATRRVGPWVRVGFQAPALAAADQVCQVFDLRGLDGVCGIVRHGPISQ